MGKSLKIVRQRRRRNCRRSPHTHQEIKANGRRGMLKFDDYSVRIRCRNLPDDRNDLWVSFAFTKHDSWKHIRRSQYRPVPVVPVSQPSPS